MQQTEPSSRYTSSNSGWSEPTYLDNAVRLSHVEPARVSRRRAPSSPSQLSDSLHWLAKKHSRRPPDFLCGHAYQDGKWEHRGDFTRVADSVRGICGAHGGYDTAGKRDVRRNCGGRGLRGRQEKEWMGFFLWDNFTAFGMNADQGTIAAQDEGEWRKTRNKGRNVSWRNGSLQGRTKDSPKKAGSCCFAHHSWLAINGANLYPPGVWFADFMSCFFSVTFVVKKSLNTSRPFVRRGVSWFVLCLFCFVFVFLCSLKPRPFVHMFFNMHAPRQPHPVANNSLSPFSFLFLSFFFVSLDMSFFPSIFVPLPFCLWMESRRTFFPSGCVLYDVTTSWFFYISLCRNSINQSINHLITFLGGRQSIHWIWGVVCFKSYATKLVLHLTLIFGAFGCNTLTGRLGAFFAYLLFVYFQVSTGVLSFLDYSEDICLVALSDPPQTLKAALYTIVPRSPFFAFCTPKYFRLQKCGWMSASTKWRYLGHLQLLSKAAAAKAEMDVSPQEEMANPQGMKVFAVERPGLSEDFVSFLLCVECNRRHSYLLRICRSFGVRYSGRHRGRHCAWGSCSPELSAQVVRADSCKSCIPAHTDASISRPGRNGWEYVEYGRDRRPRAFVVWMWTKACLSRPNTSHSRYTKPPSSRNYKQHRMWELGRHGRWN